jgi:hypothetical protein
MGKGELSKLVSVAGRVLLAFLFVFSQSAWAGQDQKTKDAAASPQKAGVQQTTERLSALGTAAKARGEKTQGEDSEGAVAEEKPGRDASHQGINVHGHWTIEVRNPDGSLIRHVEFENALDPGFAVPASGPIAAFSVSGGAAYLSGVLSGQWTAPGNTTPTFSSPTGWTILLVGPAGLNNLTSTTNSPCALSGGYVFPGACQIFQASGCGGGAGFPGFSCNLSVTPLGTSPAFNGVRLTGSVAATQNGQISTVATLMNSVACATYAANCAAAALSPYQGGFVSITSSTNFAGAPISVSAGQTIAVTVNISFS